MAVLESQVIDFKDPLHGKLKQDFTKKEEKDEEENIEREIENSNLNLSISLRTSNCTLMSQDVSINSNIFALANQS